MNESADSVLGGTLMVMGMAILGMLTLSALGIVAMAIFGAVWALWNKACEWLNRVIG